MSQPADKRIAGKAENPPAWVQGLPRKGSSSRRLPIRPQPTSPVLKIFTENYEEKMGFYNLDIAVIITLDQQKIGVDRRWGISRQNHSCIDKNDFVNRIRGPKFMAPVCDLNVMN